MDHTKTMSHLALKGEVEAESEDAKALLDAVRDVVDHDATLAQETMREVRHRYKAIDARRTAITKPLNAAKRAVDDLFRPILSVYAEIDRIATEADSKHRAIAEEKQREAMEAATTSEEIVAAVSTSGNVEGVSVRRVAKVRIVNAALVPAEYWIRSLNDAKAKIDLKAGDVPGLELYYEEIAVVR